MPVTCDYVTGKNFKFPLQTWRASEFALRIVSSYSQVCLPLLAHSVILQIIDSLLLCVYDVMQSKDVQSHVKEYCNLIGLHLQAWQNSHDILNSPDPLVRVKWSWLTRLSFHVTTRVSQGFIGSSRVM